MLFSNQVNPEYIFPKIPEGINIMQIHDMIWNKSDDVRYYKKTYCQQIKKLPI